MYCCILDQLTTKCLSYSHHYSHKNSTHNTSFYGHLPDIFPFINIPPDHKLFQFSCKENLVLQNFVSNVVILEEVKFYNCSCMLLEWSRILITAIHTTFCSKYNLQLNSYQPFLLQILNIIVKKKLFTEW